MKTIKTVIVDDEPLARKLIRTLLADAPDFEIVAECANGAEAIESIESLQPDLVFLDVQMPGIDGFGVLAALDRDRLPFIVFVTAFDQYALRAFDVHALDYLLKPVDDERFSETLQRVRATTDARRADRAKIQLLGLIEQVEAESRTAERLLVKSAGRIAFIDSGEIDWIEASGNYMRIHVGDETHLMRQTMSQMADKLDPARFARIHRSTIVNLDRVKELLPSKKGEFEVLLQNGARLVLSRKYRPLLEQRLGKSL